MQPLAVLAGHKDVKGNKELFGGELKSCQKLNMTLKIQPASMCFLYVSAMRVKARVAA